MHEEINLLKIYVKAKELRLQKGIIVEIRNYHPAFKRPKKYHFNVDEI